MNHRVMSSVLPAGSAALACAMLAFAQSPQQENPRQRTAPPATAKPGVGQAKPEKDAKTGHLQTPRYAQPLAGNLGENTVQIFKDKDFKGEQTSVTDLAKAHRTGTLNELPATYDDDASSIKWNLAPGTLVVLFDDAAADGVQLALWGKGQIADFDTVDFEDSATRWAWYDVGGGTEPRSAGTMALPHGALGLDSTIPDDSLQLFEDQQFAGDEQHTVSPVTGQAAGNWNMLPSNKENGLSSLRWNLPEGVIVMFSAEDNGNNNIVIFGEGQHSDLGAIGFDNRASRWSWAYIGSPMGDASTPGEGRTPSNPGMGTPRQPSNPPQQPSTPPSSPRDPSTPRQPATPPSTPSTPPSNPPRA